MRDSHSAFLIATPNTCSHLGLTGEDSGSVGLRPRD